MVPWWTRSRKIICSKVRLWGSAPSSVTATWAGGGGSIASMAARIAAAKAGRSISGSVTGAGLKGRDILCMKIRSGGRRAKI